ncbi:DUF6786 family protein [Emticicia sp. 21SJ11W-3]|uniref:DUF6786 family protein n=1 Tax=Emticicia sp. 21SJ11W-3 TaxID=2916755 RepID=UPI00209F578D|nr:DUF6786 family protein [Emticicia sp. 21SJ11W-3]UTA69526.1 hypothetical protein MB380_06865 [Emticicia sp. 21SJ11W-3]
MKKAIISTLAFYCMACNTAHEGNHTQTTMKQEDTFGFDYEFLKKHKEVVLLEQDSMKVAIVGDYQARVMTSTAQGNGGFSYGWINHEAIASGKYTPHMNAFGGEERFWFGPEGGQYSVFFKKGSTFDFENWQTPAEIDTVSYDLVEKQANRAVFTKDMTLENYSGTQFRVKLNREISLLNQSDAGKLLGFALKDIAWVGYQTTNALTNTGAEDWDKSKGVLSIWLLGMMKASPQNTIIIPYQSGKAELINDSYFGKIPAGRLVKKEDILFFKADAQARGKIGIPPQALKPVAGSYDAENKILTIVQFDYKGETDYVNSMWEIQKNPYNGDAINAYNDGKNDTGSQMGQFYELETSSPAIALKRNETLTHVQRTFHFEGAENALDAISKKLLGIHLSEVPKL